MRCLSRLLWLLCVVCAQAAPGAVTAHPADSPLAEIENAAAAFVRAAPVPAWADLATPPPVPAQDRHLSVVVRLWETQLRLEPAPVVLINRVLQVRQASGLAEIGQVPIEFHPKFQRLLLHKMTITRGDRVIDHTDTASVKFLQREGKLEEGVYTGVITAWIVLPGVRTGDTLQLVYSVVGENPALGTRYAQRVSWDRPHPVVLRRVTLMTPVQRQVSWRWTGGAGGAGPQPTESVEAGVRHLRFEARNLAAASAEPMMPPHARATRQLQLSEYANWNQVAHWALALFATDAPLPEETATLMSELRALSDPQEQASQALQWVQSQIRPWSSAVGEYSLRPQPPAAVVQHGYGDCKDKALLLTSILRALGIDARPALVAASNRIDPASMLPAPGVFDHVIVQTRLNGREYYLDTTLRGQTGLLSRMGQAFEGASVLPVDAATQDLVTVHSPNRDEIFRSQMHERMSLENLDGEGRLDVEIRWFGIHAESIRLSLQGMDASQKRQFAAATYLQQYAGARLLGDPQVSDDRRMNQLTIKSSFAVPSLVRAARMVWVVPFAPGLGEAVVLPPRQVRRFPLLVPSFPVTYHYQVDMTWPDGVTIIAAPQSRRMETPHFRMHTTSSVSGNTESRTVEFQAKVREVPAIEIEGLANDLDRMARQIGGVMLAERDSAPNALPQEGGVGDEQPALNRR